jgi:sigma-B regulation protein RsbU (phosphoserine phosphatase)
MTTSGHSITSQHLKLMLEVSRRLAVTTNLDDLLAHIATTATSLFDCERASIFLHDPATQQLWTKIALQSGEIRVPEAAGIVGCAFTENRVVHVPKPYDDPRFNAEPDRKSGFVTRNILAAPMLGIDGKPVGVIQAINRRRRSFDETDSAILQLLGDQAGVAIQRFQLQQKALESVALRREMDLAQRVQQALIPAKPPEIPGLAVAGWNRAASIAGGDAFDYWRLPDGRLAVFVGDASGHGIAPALVVSQVRTLIRALADIEPDPSRLLQRVNARMHEDLQDGQFITVFLGYLDQDGRLEWTSAGHGPIIACCSGDEHPRVLETPGYPLGFTPDWPDSPGEDLHLHKGGQLLVASDGIYEAFDPAGEQFGPDRVIDLLAHAGRTPADTVESIKQAIATWQGKEEPPDDQTIVIAQRV